MRTSLELPDRGNTQDFVERLVGYVSEVDPQWLSRTQPATDAQIARYMELSGLTELGVQVPGLYRGFLLSFGENEGGLLESETLRVEFSLSRICHFYQRFLPEDFQRDPDIPDFEPEQLAPQLPVIGLYYATGDQLSLDLRPGYNPNPEVRFTSAGEDISLISSSFEAFVFQRAFQYREERRLGNAVSWAASAHAVASALARTDTRDPFELVAQFAKLQSFTEAWFNDSLHFCAIRDDAALYVEMQDSGALLLTAMGKDIKSIRASGDMLAQALGASPLST